MQKTTTNERDELSQKIKRLETRYNVMMHGKLVPTPLALKVMDEIKRAEKELEALDHEAAEVAKMARLTTDETFEILSIPLIADVLNDLVTGVDGTLRRNGLVPTVFGEYTRKIRKYSLAIIDRLEAARGELPTVHDDDGFLLDAIKKKTLSYIKQRAKDFHGNSI